MKSDYSDKEFEMIRQISPAWAKVIETDINSAIMPPKMLELVARDCFLENKTGKAVESLRRCVKACLNCKPYRMTAEYDALIDL